MIKIDSVYKQQYLFIFGTILESIFKISGMNIFIVNLSIFFVKSKKCVELDIVMEFRTTHPLETDTRSICNKS